MEISIFMYKDFRRIKVIKYKVLGESTNCFINLKRVFLSKTDPSSQSEKTSYLKVTRYVTIKLSPEVDTV